MGIETQPHLPRDRNDNAIQVLTPDDTTVAQVAFGAGNQTAPLPTDSTIVEVVSTDFCRIAFGDETVDATVGTRRIFPPGGAVYRVPSGATRVAVTQIGTSTGFVTVTRMS